MGLRILVRGGGDLASGVILRLVRSGMDVVVLELPAPLAVRRTVSFAQAVFDGQIVIEGIAAKLVDHPNEAAEIAAQGVVAVLIDPLMESFPVLSPDILVDARMLKKENQANLYRARLDIGMGPGFTVGLNCEAVIETKRGPDLGRVYWQGEADQDTGLPDPVGLFEGERVLRSPTSGKICLIAQIGDRVAKNGPIAEIDGQLVVAPFGGVLRGIVHDGLVVNQGMKIGDLDPRNDSSLCYRVSDKALAVGGGVLEAILTKPDLRRMLGSDVSQG